MIKKYKKSKSFNKNQRSFYFQDYIATNLKQKKIKKSPISEDRIYILFFFFFCLIAIFALKITLVSVKNPNLFLLL